MNVYELWMRRGTGQWRALRESPSEEALRLDMQKRAYQLRDQYSPFRTEFAVRKVGSMPALEGTPDEVVEPFASP